MMNGNHEQKVFKSLREKGVFYLDRLIFITGAKRQF